MPKIKISLSADSVQEAIDEIEEYQEGLKQKCKDFCERMIDIGLPVANAKIGESPLGSTITVESEITPEEAGCKGILMAVGETKTSLHYSTPFNTLLAVEFGAGIHYNGGTSNPKAEEFGMGVGTFPGQKFALLDTWYYLGDDDEWHPSHGVKATMPMYKASVEMEKRISEIAHEIFGSNEGK